MRTGWPALGCVLAMTLACAGAQSAAQSPSPSQKSVLGPGGYAALAKLPNWSGVWEPNIRNQDAQQKDMPWNAAAAAQIAAMEKEQVAGRPRFILADCLPAGMPSWMLMTHEAMEILFTPGRVTMLGDGDGNRLRRIHTDGRGHPDDPDLTFFGDSVGHWEGQTLVVDTVGILPQVQLAVSEAVGIPNNGGMHVTERLHLVSPTELHDDLVIEAPKVLTKPYVTTRIWTKQATPDDVYEGVCQQGQMRTATDAHGNAVFVPQKVDEYGVPIAEGK